MTFVALSHILLPIFQLCSLIWLITCAVRMYFIQKRMRETSEAIRETENNMLEARIAILDEQARQVRVSAQLVAIHAENVRAPISLSMSNYAIPEGRKIRENDE